MRSSALIRSSSNRSVIVLTILLLTVGFGEGLALGLKSRLGLPSPWMVLFPIIVVCFVCYVLLARQPVAARFVVHAEVAVWLLVLGLVIQVVIDDHINLGGYGQLCLFVTMLVLIRGVFAAADPHIRGSLSRAVMVAYVFLCGYVVAAWAIWHATGIDISIARVINPDVAVTYNPYYGFRPASWSTEPTWMAMSISVGYMGVHYLLPRRRLMALMLLTISAILLQSAFLLLFNVVVAAMMALKYSHGPRIVAVLAFAGAMAIAVSAYPRVGGMVTGSDGSTNMRVASAAVAVGVISRSLPFGVGYGNFRDVAIYGPEWSAEVGVVPGSYYKSDLAILNLAAELGVGGLALVAYCFWVLRCGSLLLPSIYLLMAGVGSGTLMLPGLLVLAAIVGSLDRGSMDEEGFRREQFGAVPGRSTAPRTSERVPAGGGG